MKVLLAQQHLRMQGPLVSGEDTALYYLSKGLARHGLETYVVIQDAEMDQESRERLTDDGVRLVEVRRPYSIRSYLKKASLDNKPRFSIVHSLEVRRALLFAFLKTKGQPVIVHYLNPLSSLPFSKGRFRYVLNRCDRIFVPSRFVSDKLSEILKIPPEKISIIPNGVDVDVFRNNRSELVEEHLGIPPEAEVVLFAGRCTPIKGLDTVVESIPAVLAAHPAAFFVFAGAYEPASQYFQGLVRRIRQLGVEKRCLFTKNIPHSDLSQVISRASMSVIPSSIDAFPLAGLESLACGTPIVASDAGGLPELVAPGVGVLFPPGDASMLAESILLLMSDDKLARDMGRRGRSLVESQFTWDSVSLRVVEEYEKLPLSG